MLKRLGFALCALVLSAAAVLAIGLASLFAAIGPSRADDCGVTLERARELGRGVAAENPDVAFTEYSGDEARKIIAEINAAPPVSDWDADVIVVIDPKDGPFRVGISLDGCVRHAFGIPRGAWADVLRSALGDKS